MTGETTGGRSHLLAAIILIGVILAAAGTFFWFRNISAPSQATLGGWQWRRSSMLEDGRIKGVLQAEIQASGRLAITGVEGDSAAKIEGINLPLQAVRSRSGRTQAEIALIVPDVSAGQRPLNLWIDYQMGGVTGKLGPIVLLP